MSATRTVKRAIEISPRMRARIAGLLYLAAGEAYSFAAMSVRGKLMVPGDAMATAANILAHENMYRWGFAAELISPICFIALAVMFYYLFRPVKRGVSLLAALLSIAGSGIQACASLLHYAPLVILQSQAYSGAFKLEQLQALALLSLDLRTTADSIYMVFFGTYNILLGYLIFRSRFMPRILGVFMALAGVTYQAYLWPPLAVRLFPYVLKPAGALGELSLILWLIAMGVNSLKWNEQAGEADSPQLA